MRIAVISDTHGNIEQVTEKTALLSVDAIFHLGDYTRDADEIRGHFSSIPFYSVRGNCDRDSNAPENLLINLDGHALFAAHGHRQGVKLSLYGIYFAAYDNDADIALFGHTHSPLVKEKSGILLINPGSGGHTMALLQLDGADRSAEIIDLGN